MQMMPRLLSILIIRLVPCFSLNSNFGVLYIGLTCNYLSDVTFTA